MKSVAIENVKSGEYFLYQDPDTRELLAWINLGVHERYDNEQKTPKSYWAEAKFAYGETHFKALLKKVLPNKLTWLLEKLPKRRKYLILYRGDFVIV